MRKRNQGKRRVRLVYGGRGRPDPDPPGELELLDWDFHINNIPEPYWTKTIKATFRCVGRSKPIPVYED